MSLCARRPAAKSLPLIAAALLSVVYSQQAFAAANPNTAHDKSDTTHESHLITGEHVEGHIAFLHAELGITPEQEPLWNAVANSMRTDVSTMKQAEQNVGDRWVGSETAPEYLYNRAMFAGLRADGEARFYNAFEPLYDSLSDAQKDVADDILIPHHPAEPAQ
jgi:protein CpxP